MTARRVIIESPYAGNVDENLRYLRRAMRQSLVKLGESPFASHGLYTQEGVLNDNDREERNTGIEAGFAWHHKADLVAVYCDYGISSGMKRGITNARLAGVPVVFRWIGRNKDVE